MAKQDFQMIADVIVNSVDLSGRDRQALAERFAARLAKANPRFDRARFLKACGVES